MRSSILCKYVIKKKYFGLDNLDEKVEHYLIKKMDIL